MDISEIHVSIELKEMIDEYNLDFGDSVIVYDEQVIAE